MKKYLLCTLFVLFFGGVLTAGYVTKFENCRLDNGTIIPYRDGEIFYKAGFSANSRLWDKKSIQNYSGLLDIKFDGNILREPCMLVTASASYKKIKDLKKDKDTAWSVSSHPIKFRGTPGPYVMSFRISGNLPLEEVMSNAIGYNTGVVWLSADNKELKTDYLRFSPITNSRYTEIRTEGIIPEGAAKFKLMIGFDAPNFGQKSYCAIQSITLSKLDKPAANKVASFETAPMPSGADRRIAFYPTRHGKSSVKVQAAAGNMVDGKIVWGKFIGPDGTERSWHEQKNSFLVRGEYVKLRVQLVPDGRHYPVLRAISVGGVMHDKWYFRSKFLPPVVENLTVSPTDNRRQDIVLKVVSQLPVDYKSFTATLDDLDVTDQFTRNGDVFTFKTDEDYSDGRHTVNVSIKNIDGQVTEQIKYLYIGKNPAVPRITLRKDGMTLIDGKPFFPIGIYGVCPREFNGNSWDKAVKDLAEGGFNLLHTYSSGSTIDPYFKAADKYGMKIWLRVGEAVSDRFMKSYLPLKNVIAWYICDDTADKLNPAQLQDLNDALKAVDDCRITTHADMLHGERPISRFHDYARTADNFLPEIYPVFADSVDDRNTCVADVIRDMKICNADIENGKVDAPRSVWAIIQYFKGWNSWHRFPEADELRAMTYAAIIQGATGVTWYTYGGFYDEKKKRSNDGITSTPERWKAITTLTKQLNALTPVLTEVKAEKQPVVKVIAGPAVDHLGYPSISCMMKIHNGESYIFAVNSAPVEVKAEFQLDGAVSGEVIDENRSVTFKEGKMSDTFAPNTVHIYKCK